MELGKWISKNDALVMLEIINLTLCCKSKEDYIKLIDQLNGLILFDHSSSGLVDMQNICCENMNSCSINIGYPDEFMEAYTNQKYHLVDPMYQRFLKTLEIQSLSELQDYYKDSIRLSPVLSLSHDFGLYNTFLYGIYRCHSTPFTVFTITGQQIKNDNRTRAIIKTLVPYLSISLKNLIPLPMKKDTMLLTPMELETLKWLKEGKSSWEIAMILNRSERTVTFHICNIIRKLNAANRTHAVAIALERNILTL